MTPIAKTPQVDKEVSISFYVRENMDKEKAKEEAWKKYFATRGFQTDSIAQFERISFDAGYAAALSASSGWVAVSERLPETEGEYLVIHKWKGEDFRYCSVIEWQRFGQWNTDDFGRVDELEFVAWMPIPIFPPTVEENKV